MLLKWLKLVFNYSFIGLFAFPVLPLNIAVLFLAVPFLTVIINALMQHQGFNKLSSLSLPAILLGCIALFYLFYLPFAQSFEIAWFEFEKRAGLLVIPLFFLLIPINWFEQVWKKALGAFLLSVSFLGLLWLIFHFSGLAETHIPDENAPYFYKLRTTFEDFTELHPTYYGLFAGTTILVLLHFTLAQTGWKKRILPFSLIGISAAGLFLSGARMALAATVVAAIVLLILHKKYLFILVLGFLASIGFFAGKDVILPRMENISSLFSGEENTGAKGTSIRKGITACSVRLISENWLTGVGSDVLQHQLNACYQAQKNREALAKNLNTHNEYANLLLSFGLLGGIILISYFISLFRIGLKHPIILAIALLLALQFLTENILSRQHGVFLVALFSSFMLYWKSADQKTA